MTNSAEKHTLCFLSGGSVREIDEAMFYEIATATARFAGIGGVTVNAHTRIPEGDYHRIVRFHDNWKGTAYLHFNRSFNVLGRVAPQKGSTHIFCRLVVPGTERLDPILSFHDGLVARCVDVSTLSFRELAQWPLRHALHGIKTPKDVLELLHRWYTTLRQAEEPTMEQLSNEGVSLTIFEILGQITISL